MARLDLDPAKLVEEFPRLIVCSISGFGQYGPMHQQAAYDTVIQAISGIMDGTGWPDGAPPGSARRSPTSSPGSSATARS